MRSDHIAYLPFGYPWSADNKRHVNIFLESALFARLEPMLADVVAIVAGVEDICVVKDSSLVKACNDLLDNLVHCLESLETLAIEFIVEVDVFFTLLW